VRIAALAAVVVTVVAVAPEAHADDKVSCELLEINASKGTEASVPADLKPLAKKLKKPPFSSWNVFKLLSRTTRDLIQLKAQTVTLTLGQATVLFRDVERRGDKARIALTVTTEDENGKRLADTKVNIDSGDYIVLGRTLPNDEGHLLAVTCKPYKHRQPQ
jgi:hypothetical protein